MFVCIWICIPHKMFKLRTVQAKVLDLHPSQTLSPNFWFSNEYVLLAEHFELLLQDPKCLTGQSLCSQRMERLLAVELHVCCRMPEWTDLQTDLDHLYTVLVKCLSWEEVPVGQNLIHRENFHYLRYFPDNFCYYRDCETYGVGVILCVLLKLESVAILAAGFVYIW